MTLTTNRDLAAWDDELEADAPTAASGTVTSSASTSIEPELPSARRIAVLASVWVLVALVGATLVVYTVEPLFQQRTQAALLAGYRTSIFQAAQEAQGLPGIEAKTKPPELGDPVAVIEIGRLQFQQVAVEGVSPRQTQGGPGHVVGTAGPGQPGNSAIVARRGAFGGPFGELDQVRTGDQILITTTQGQTVYKVESVRQQTLTDAPAVSETAPVVASSSGGEEAAPEDPATAASIGVDTLFGPTRDDRLTLVTSASANPLNASAATVVRAKLEGSPFAPTPQGGRTASQTGRTGDSAALAGVVLALLALIGAGVGAVFLYRRSSFKVAYLLVTAPLLVAVIVFAEAASLLLPAWM